MKKFLTVFPNDPFPIISGLNSINIQNLNLFWNVVKDIQMGKQEFSVLTLDNHLLDYSKQLIILGDLINCPTPQTIFIKQIFKKLKKLISDDAIDQIYLLDRKIRNIFKKEIFTSDLPLSISDNWSLDDIIKLMGVSCNFDQGNTPLEIISEFIDLSFCLDDRRILFFTNLNRYLTKLDRKKIAHECISKNTVILSINLVTEGIENAYNQENVCFIDNDFVQFTN